MKLQKEFLDFYSLIRIDREQEPLREKRERLESSIRDNLPGLLKKYDIDINGTDIRVIDQGSYKYSTTIKADIFDRDVAIIVPMDPNKISAYLAKMCLREAIEHPSRTVVVKEPCIRAVYHEDGVERYHIDLPLYANDYADNKFLARGKKNDGGKWEEADPDGLNEYLLGRLSGNDQLRRIICFIKKWKNEHYKSPKSDHEVPPSIGLTFLACDCFQKQTDNGGENDLRALYHTMKGIRDCFVVSRDYNGNITSATISRTLPVKPYTDIFSKMYSYNPDYIVTFFNRINDAVKCLENAIYVEADHDAALYVRKVLGDEFSVPEKRAVDSNTTTKREHNFG